MLPYSLCTGWLLDLLLGDPSWLPHPVVAFGRWISFWEHRLNHGRHRMLKGGVMAVASIALVFCLTALVIHLLREAQPLLALAFCALLIFFCLAGHTLRREVRDVFLALDRSLDDGRHQVARIVGRDTQQLTAQEVRTAALETLAENLSDGVIAPLFWLALLGVPGMMAYKMVNTLDSMIAYRTERYRRFGCWAAHIDDVANFIPARITAGLILIAHQLTGPRHTVAPAGTFTDRLRFVRHYGPCHASPNSGWPEAALAACLNCQFGGTHDYFGQPVEKPHIGDNPRVLNNDDLRTSLRVALIAEVTAVILTLLACTCFV